MFPAGLALAWYSVSRATDLVETIKTSLTTLLTEDLSKVVPLLSASRPRLNALDSIFTTAWLPLLPDQQQTEIAYHALHSRCEDVLRGLVSGTSTIEEWAFVQSVLGDDSAPIQLQPLLKKATLATNFDSIVSDGEPVRFPVLISVARQVGLLGDQPVAHVRAQLLRLTKSLAESANAITGSDKEDMRQALLSAAFEFYRADRPNENNCTELSLFLWELVSQYPQLAEHCQVFVDALVQGLPNIHSRLFWQLQIRLAQCAEPASASSSARLGKCWNSDDFTTRRG